MTNAPHHQPTPPAGAPRQDRPQAQGYQAQAPMHRLAQDHPGQAWPAAPVERSDEALAALLRRDQLRIPGAATAAMCLGLIASVLVLYAGYQFDAGMRRGNMFQALAEGRVTGGFGLLWFPQFLPLFAAIAGFIAFPLRRTAPLIGAAVLSFLAVVAAVGTLMIGNPGLGGAALWIIGTGTLLLITCAAGAFASRRY